MPSLIEVREAIDVADLFIRCIEGKLKMPTNEFYLTDIHNIDKEDSFKFGMGYSISFDFRIKKLNIRELLNQVWRNEIEISVKDSEYHAFLRLMNSIDDEFEISESFKAIAKLIGHPMPVKHIEVKQY